jgi:hypothetical protein
MAREGPFEIFPDLENHLVVLLIDELSDDSTPILRLRALHFANQFPDFTPQGLAVGFINPLQE